MQGNSFDRFTRVFSSSESRRSALRTLLRFVLGSTLLGYFPEALATASSQICTAEGQCDPCLTASDCSALEGGTVACEKQRCIKTCTNPLHRICGPGASVCQECCNDDVHCRKLDVEATCQDGTCQCPEGLTFCGKEEKCVNTNREPYHCGRCGNRCRSGTCDNGQCQASESCGPLSTPQDDSDCAPGEFPCDKVCDGNERVCPPGLVDCGRAGVCEACGRCDVTVCPPNLQGGPGGSCCSDGRCSCGDTCCPSGSECFIEMTGGSVGSIEDDPVVGSSVEVCAPCNLCWGTCCTDCHNGACQTLYIDESAGVGGTIRRLRSR